MHRHFSTMKTYMTLMRTYQQYVYIFFINYNITYTLEYSRRSINTVGF